MHYPIAIETGTRKHAYGVVVPDLPGCFSAGDTLDEAMDNAREAIELWLEVAIDDGLPVPEATSLAKHCRFQGLQLPVLPHCASAQGWRHTGTCQLSLLWRA